MSLENALLHRREFLAGLTVVAVLLALPATTAYYGRGYAAGGYN